MSEAASTSRLFALKAQAEQRVDDHLDHLLDISRRLHDDPETAWEEHRSAAMLRGALGSLGLTVTEGLGGLDTAFAASCGHGSSRIAVLAEYDALPGLGHACGHNIIAAAAVGAAAALRDIVDEIDCTLTVIGSPAEEGGGGKILLADAGVFDDVDIAMMIHPSPVDAVYARPLAVAHFDVIFHGKEAHAAAFPAAGVNAADAFTIAQVAIGLLRQQLPAGVYVHGVVRDAGQAPNAIPGYARGSWYVRAANLHDLDAVFDRVAACFRAGASATGCRMELIETSPRYSEFTNDEPLVAAFAANASALGRDLDIAERRPLGMNRASTDMGNVSRLVRAIHPYLGIDSGTAANHQEAFAAASVAPGGERAVRDGAVLLAQTIIDAALAAAPGPVEENHR